MCLGEAESSTLEGVLENCAAGERAAGSAGKSELLAGFETSADEKSDLLAFLESLTNEHFLNDPRFASPWPADPPKRGGDTGAQHPKRVFSLARKGSPRTCRRPLDPLVQNW